MSTPTMNHGSQTQQQTEQQQQQQQTTQINEIQPAHSNSSSSPHATLTRSDSTSTVILEEEETRTCRRNGTTTMTPALLASLSAQLRSLMKTGGLFNTDMESSDKLREFFASGNGFALERLLSEVDPKDFNLNAEDLITLDSFKLDARTLSEFLRSESFDQLIASAAINTDGTIHPHATSSSSTSFSELRSVSPDLKKDASHPSLFTPIHSVDVSTTSRPQQGTLNAIQHDHAFLAKRTPADEASSSSSTTISKRTQGRRSTRISTRLQSRAVCTSTPAATTSNNSPTRIKRGRNVNRAKDVQTPDDLNYYLERRRKNNEASKVSRAVRKQKFGDMDEKCDEYERVNTELQLKITTLEKVTASLKNGLVNNFQRKN